MRMKGDDDHLWPLADDDAYDEHDDTDDADNEDNVGEDDDDVHDDDQRWLMLTDDYVWWVIDEGLMTMTDQIWL